ncbi:hypothetical protein [Opitutus sp. GAS368]|jgi:hypothetical protein|uniref:hypothetical protein n=1 Tax=Opitutus sp. GAS368 TaxID=1882749 RepID=UPI00087B4403|nr:hypothetical protein [Opitutus sp. GAS368]SDR66695.1 hypothetical protein SAMN05444173_0222 [Opitutus sp. GAS368]
MTSLSSLDADRIPVQPSPQLMSSPVLLTGSHLRTYEAIFRHPAAQNLQWHDVLALFRHIGQVEEETNGNLKVTRHGRVLVLHPPRSKDVGATEELMALRHFLERSAVATPVAPVPDGAHWLLVIDHHEARIFRTEMDGAHPKRIRPHQPAHLNHTPNSKDFTRGQEKPDPTTFFEPVAQALAAAGPVLVFGHGKGNASEMDQFIAWAKVHHPALAGRIIGAQVVDDHHLNESQLLGKAREFYAHAPQV